MRFLSVTLLIGASIVAGCADPSLAARTAARAEAWRRAWRERHEAALARDCHRGYLIGGDDRCPYRRRIERTLRPRVDALPFADARSSSGSLVCGVSRGRLTCGVTEPGELPTDGATIAEVEAVDLWAAGHRNLCVARSARRVECWFGGLVDGRFPRDRTEERAVGDLPAPAVELGAGYLLACARLGDGSVWCWKTGPRPDRSTAAALPRRMAVPPARRLLVGGDHACVVTHDASLWCWGSLGVDWMGAEADCVLCSDVVRAASIVGSPARLAARVRGAAVTTERVCAILADGGVECWDGHRRSCVIGSQDRGPIAVPELSGSSELALAGYAICGLVDAGRVRCVIDGTARADPGPEIASTRVVTEVALTAPATALWGGLDFVCASTEGGGRSCWGVDDLAPDEWRRQP